MYRTCIFCSRGLGANDAIELFPVGRSVAFDARRGRLWAVCGRCSRWNLAPIEERWESVEVAEKLFRDSRVRVHSENVGLTRLRDGTRLIRIGEAIPGEIAALRYSGHFMRRRRAHIAGIGAVAAGTAVFATSMPLLMAAGVPLGVASLGLQAAGLLRDYHHRRRIVHRIAADASPTGTPITLRRMDLYGATLCYDAASGGAALTLPGAHAEGDARVASDATELVLTGPAAERAVARLLTDYNARGATGADVESALARLGEAGHAHALIERLAQQPLALARPQIRKVARGRPYTPRQILGTFRGEVLPVTKYRSPFLPDARGTPIGKLDALALEMALNEERERAAMEGELAALEAAWREAEEIAAIADALPVDLGPRVDALRRSLRADRT